MWPYYFVDFIDYYPRITELKTSNSRGLLKDKADETTHFPNSKAIL